MGKKLYYIIKIIYESNEEFITTKQIQLALEKQDIYMDIKTVRNLIHIINDFFSDLIGDDMIIVKHRLGYTVNKTLFSFAELQYLMSTIRDQQDLSDDDKQAMMTRLRQISPNSISNRIETESNKENVVTFSLLKNIETLQDAIYLKKKVQFNYISYDLYKGHLRPVNTLKGNDANNKELYVISPYKIFTMNNHYYLISKNSDYSKLVVYRIDRMRNILKRRASAEEFLESFDIDKEINKMINAYTSDELIESLVLEVYSQNTLREIVSRFGEGLEGYLNELGHYIITVHDVRYNDGLTGWIMMMSKQLKVIGPDYLNHKIKNEFKEILKQY